MAAVCLAVLASTMRLAFLLGGSLHRSLAYDDGVYVAQAIRLSHGRLPYRDYTNLAPPGGSILLQPFVWLGRIVGDDGVALTSARIGIALLAGATTWLLARRGRASGPPLPEAAAFLYAVVPVVLASDKTVLLEPILTFSAVLTAAVIAQGEPETEGIGRRRLAAAGVIVGAACTVKIWAGCAVIALALTVALRPSVRGRAKDLLLVAVSVGGSILAVMVPITLLIGPSDPFRQVVLTQVRRAGNGGEVIDRLGLLFDFGERLGHPVGLVLLLGLIAAAAVAIVGRQQPTAFVFAAGYAIISTLLIATSSTFYDHYTAFFGGGILVALAFADVAMPRLGAAPDAGRGGRRTVPLACVMGLLVGIGSLTMVSDLRGTIPDVANGGWQQRDELPDLGPYRSADRCVLTFDPGVRILEGIPDVERCGYLVDPFGLRMDRLSNGSGSQDSVPTAGAEAAAIWPEVLAQLTVADAVLVEPEGEEQYLDQRGWTYIHEHFDLQQRRGRYELWVRVERP